MDVLKVDRIQAFFRQEYMRTKDINPANPNEIAIHAVAEILGKNIEAVRPEETALIRFLFYNSTMDFNKPRMNGITDEQFRQRVRNMYQYIDAGFSVDYAMEHSSEPYIQEKVQIIDSQTKEMEKSDKITTFKKKYPLLFDEKGDLRPEAVDVLDMLLEQHVPQLARKERINPNGVFKSS